MIPPLQSEPVDSKTLMKYLAEDDDIQHLNIDGEEIIDKTKLFLVAQAKNELHRVIKMTNYLDKLEEKFMSIVDERLDENPDNLQLVTSAMEVITNSLKRSNDIILQVIKDEKLSALIVNTTNIITADGSSSSVIDANSRDNIRNMASSLLAQLSVLGNNTNNNIIDTGGDNNE